MLSIESWLIHCVRLCDNIQEQINFIVQVPMIMFL